MTEPGGGGTFTDQAAALGAVDTGQGRGVAALDYDRDGDIDLFIANNGGPPRLFRNDSGNSGQFLRVKLLGRRRNTEAIGARIFVTANGETQMRELRAGSNYVSQDPAEAHFGLGGATYADDVRVVWPNGDTLALGSMKADQFVTIAQPGAITCQAPLAGAICLPGGGEPSTDCFLELVVDAPQGATAAENRVSSHEGDPRCDFDPDPTNGACTFHVSLCINNTDLRVPSCVPSVIAALKVLRPKANPSSTADARTRRALERAAGSGSGGFGMLVRPRMSGGARRANDSPDLCGPPADVIVPRRIAPDESDAIGRRLISIVAVTPTGQRDADWLRLECQSPQP